MNSKYDIGKIDSGIKGVMSKRYRKHLLENDRARHDCIVAAGQDADGFVFWQKGGGFDRNMWNSTAIHNSVRYIEANPVRSRLVDIAEEWPWSSAYARARPSAEVVMPDAFSMPVALPDPQFQSVGRM
jgi:REP element-mobilizing transposase RayT